MHHSLSPASRRLPPILFAAIAIAMLLGGHARAQTPARSNAVSGAANVPVTLLHSGQTLSPSSTFEIRFAEPMVSGNSAEAPSPIVVTPRIKGRWEWRSDRSGVFIPEEPVALGSSLALSLAPKLRNASGNLVGHDWRTVLTAPSFAIKGVQTDCEYRDKDIGRSPVAIVAFNAPVSPEKASKFFRYVNYSGKSVAARVESYDPKRPGCPTFSLWRCEDRQIETWSEQSHRFIQKSSPAKHNSETSDLQYKLARSARPNLLVVTPEKPLEPGIWTLIADPGLPADEGGYLLATSRNIDLGTVTRFEIASATAENLIDSGSRIRLEFYTAVAESMVENGVCTHVTVEPMPNGPIVWSIEGTTLVGAAPFATRSSYTVTVAPTLRSATGFELGTTAKKTVTIPAIPSRLYFEDFSTHQQRFGNRLFHLRSVNIATVRIAAHRFQNDNPLEALEAYERYDQPAEKAPDDEPFSAVPTEKFSAALTYTREIPLKTGLDEKKVTALSWDEILGPGNTGMVLLTATQVEEAASGKKRVGTQSLVQVTDIGVAWKSGSRETLVFAWSLATGEPLHGAMVRLFDLNKKEIVTAKTDATGVALLPTDGEQKWLLVRKDADQHVVRFDDSRDYQYYASYRTNIDGGETETDAYSGSRTSSADVFLFSDRNIYKAGETVHLKGIVRNTAGGLAGNPAGRKGTFQIVDGKGRKVLSTPVVVSRSGSFNIDYEIPDLANGVHSAFVIWDGGTGNGALDDDAEEGEEGERRSTNYYFRVGEYQPDAFEVKLTAPKTLMVDAKADVGIAAQYFLGKSLGNAQVSYTVKAATEDFTAPGFSKFTFAPGKNSWRMSEVLDSRVTKVDQGDLRLAADGTARLPISAAASKLAPAPVGMQVIAEVTDINQQVISAETTVTAHASDWYLGVGELPEVIREGEELVVPVVAVSKEGKGLAVSKPIKIRLSAVDWLTNRVETAGGGTAFENKPTLRQISEIAATTVMAKETPEGFVPEDSAAPKVTIPTPGEYLLQVLGTDDAGRTVLTSVSLFAYGKGAVAWNYRNKYQVDLVPDAKQYRTGSTATILVKTPINGPALVTVERDGVLRHFTTTLDGNAPSVEVPLLPGDAPNVFVSVVAVRGANASPRKVKVPEFRFGYCTLNVERPESKLHVNVTLSHPEFRPGATGEATATVLSNTGKPVAGAEVTFYAVDEGVLSLTGYKTPEPHSYFNRRRGLFTEFGITLPSLLNEDPADRSFANKGYLIGGGFEKGMGSIRERFLACAFWNAALITDARGMVRTKFTVPDGLTRYRVIAVAHTGEAQFGTGESAFAVNRPVMVEPSVPMIGHVGDELLLRGVVHNLTASDGQAVVTARWDGTVSAESTVRRVAVKAGGSVPFDFPVKVIEPGEARWNWEVQFQSDDGKISERDSVAVTQSMLFPVPELRQAIPVTLTPGDHDLAALIDPELRSATPTVVLTVGNSRLANITAAVQELLTYPYGCVEQTTSSLMPWLVLGDLEQASGLAETNVEVRKKAIQRGANRLLSMQTESGGLSYWPGGKNPMIWASAYGGLGLVLAAKAGATVPPEAVTELVTYLRDQLPMLFENPKYSNWTEAAMVLYTLSVAKAPEPAFHEKLFQQRAMLDAELRSLLAAAITESDGPTAMVTKLLSEAAIVHDEARPWFGGNERAAAMRLFALSRTGRTGPVLNDALNDVLDRRQQGAWRTTQGNAWSLIALAEYARRVETTSDPRCVATVSDQKPVEFTKRGQTTSRKWKMGTAAAATVHVETGTLYGMIEVSARPKTLTQARSERGIRVQRNYWIMADGGSRTPLDSAQVGDRIQVELILDTQLSDSNNSYLALSDRLPATLEPLTGELVSRGDADTQGVRSTAWISHRETRAEGVNFFMNYLPAGRHTITYFARVRAAGLATAPACKTELMYEPEKYGLTETRTIRTVPLAP
jgi:uncharacterized protein YfaS (alpha-2-macroglobulin family)